MRLVQFLGNNGKRQVGLVSEDGKTLQVVAQFRSVYDLAIEADQTGSKIVSLVNNNLSPEIVDYDNLVEAKLLLPPLDHPDPAHCFVTGTGLTHIGSAETRDKMHIDEQNTHDEHITDTMRMFRWGLEGGKPPSGQISVQPEWFYKGNGNSIVAPEQSIQMPPYALDGGEEPELVGLYVVGQSGDVRRIGFAIGNEFSDHIMEKQNYLYLAHSKLRQNSFGPELLIGDLPKSIEGKTRIIRNNNVLWESPFLTGEANMSYRIEALEHHHFKYDDFRVPGDVHCHFFGTDTLSFADRITTRPGDLFEITATGFGRSLRNHIEARSSEEQQLIKVNPL